MSRALVLGGGGPVGIGWQSGLIVGLAEAGVELAAADRVIGTSAGSAVGALLTSGADLGSSLELVGGATGPAVDLPPGGMEALFAALAEASSAPTPDEARQRLGRVAISAPTVDEERYVALFEGVTAEAWPAAFACTAVDVESGEPRLWEAHDGVPLATAVASSCAVPGIFPPVTIQGRRYMDGGMRTALNADLAAGAAQAVAVSCFALELPEGMSDPLIDSLNAQIHAELDGLRAGGTALEVVVPGPEMLDISGWGLHLMDFGRAADAFAAGRRQAEVEAERLRGVWAG